MYIFIEALTGLKIRLKVVPDDSIENIKHKIMMCEDIPMDEQHLIFHEKELENHKTLNHYGITNDTTIRLVIKLKGGPISIDMDYEDILSERASSELAEQLAIVFLENGEIRFLPILGLDMQNKSIKQTKEDLNDPSIFSTFEEPLNDQKLTILKLKMDCIRLGKKLSNMSRQQDHTKSIEINNDTSNTRINKSVHSSLHRSISLDSRPLEIFSEMTNCTKKFKNNHFTANSLRSPSSSNIYRTMSVLDTIKSNKDLTSTFPPILNVSKIGDKSHNFDQYRKEILLDNNKNSKLQSYESRQRLPPLNESEYENKKINLKRPKCPICSKKMSIINEFICRCGGHYCSKHKYPEEHNCRYDYKFNGRIELMKSNPIIESKKIAKI